MFFLIRKKLLLCSILVSLLPAGIGLAQISQVREFSRPGVGAQTLQAFSFIAMAARQSIVKVNIDGETVALGTVIAPDGLAITKASELKAGKLTCWLAGGKEVHAELIVVDEERDLALIKVDARGLEPIQWAEGEPSVGQWAITPGIEELPQAFGIISTLPRRIRFPRAYVGIQFDLGSNLPRVREVIAGLGAEKAGLAAGDIILAVNGVSVTNQEEVIKVLMDFRDGQTVKLALQRDTTRLEKEVTLKVPPSDQFGFAPSPRRKSINGDISARAEGFESVIQHDTILQPWLCGGPLMDLEGKAVGINIARAGRVATYALPAGIAKRVAKDLALRIPTSSRGARTPGS